MREERIRKEHVGREAANRRGEPCSHEEMQQYQQQEHAEHLAEAHENFQRIQELDEIFIGKRVATRGRNASDYCCTASHNGYECHCNQ